MRHHRFSADFRTFLIKSKLLKSVLLKSEREEREREREREMSRIFVTLQLYFAIVCLGLSGAVLGPTLIAIGDQIDVNDGRKFKFSVRNESCNVFDRIHNQWIRCE